jgi:hypothetical protein
MPAQPAAQPQRNNQPGQPPNQPAAQNPGGNAANEGPPEGATAEELREVSMISQLPGFSVNSINCLSTIVHNSLAAPKQ